MSPRLPAALVIRYQRAAELVADSPEGGVWLDQKDAEHVAAVIDELVELLLMSDAAAPCSLVVADPLAELEAARKDVSNG